MKKTLVYQMAVTALMTAVTCVLGPLSIPIGPIPISLTILPILLSAWLLDWMWAGVSVLLYLLIGLAGLPVFSGFQGGVWKLAGPTGGFLVGFLPMVLVSALIIRASKGKVLPSVLGMALGVLIDYAMGTAWFMITTGNALAASLSVTVLPFIPVDLGKIAVATVAGKLIRNALERSSYLPPRQ